MAVSKNVYELAQERLELIFKEFDTICVSFSGGKDSGVLLNLCIDYIRRNNLKRKLCDNDASLVIFSGESLRRFDISASVY